MRILITGANGQLGRDLVKVLSSNHEVFGFARERLDVSEALSVRQVMNFVKPDTVIHAAAYTAVDRAETEVEKTFLVNAIGSHNVALSAEEVGAKVCYISTDYVFDGTQNKPYREYDAVRPATVYGRSKLAGEILTQNLSSRHFIVRTSWVFGAHGTNFVKTMMSLGKQGASLRVVNDQRGCPTYTVDLAMFLEKLVSTEKYGVYHVSNTGSCTWFEFAEALFEKLGWFIKVNPCTTQEFPRPAPRPHYSVMDHIAIRTNGFDELPHWKDALERFLIEYVPV